MTENVAVVDDGTGLAGSTLTMIEGVRRVHELARAPLLDASLTANWSSVPTTTGRSPPERSVGAKKPRAG